MRETNNVTFRVYSAALKAADIAAKTGIVPDSTWAAGDKYGAFGAAHPKNGLELESKLGPASYLDEHIREMLRRLAPSAQKLGQLGNDVEVIFTCKIETKRIPILHFDRDTVRWLAVMNAKLDIDSVQLNEPPPPKPASGGAAGAAGGAKPSGF